MIRDTGSSRPVESSWWHMSYASIFSIDLFIKHVSTKHLLNVCSMSGTVSGILDRDFLAENG